MTPSTISAATPTQDRTAGFPLTDFVQQLEDYVPTVRVKWACILAVHLHDLVLSIDVLYTDIFFSPDTRFCNCILPEPCRF